MNMLKRIEAVEDAMGKKNGDNLPLLVIRLDGETEQDALKRLGLKNQSRNVIFLSETDWRL